MVEYSPSHRARLAMGDLVYACRQRGHSETYVVGWLQHMVANLVIDLDLTAAQSDRLIEAIERDARYVRALSGQKAA